jgi:subtilisin
VAPGVRLWAVRILDSAGNGLISWYICGLDWITAQRDPDDPSRPLFEAVNMSVAKAGADDHQCGLVNADLMHQAICRLVASGVTVVAAAGNNGFSASKLKPASYNEVITVSALADTDGKPGGLGGPLCYSWGGYDRDDTFADFSNYGGDVDLIAPGKCIWSTLPGNRYGYMSGTSMAAPHVTGAVALYKASRPLATPTQVRAALRTAGTLDWNTATDPDSTHEPLLDVSHIVALGDWTIDATPGTSRSAFVGGAGGTLQLPLSLIRAEDFPGAVSLAITADAPLTATLGAETRTRSPRRWTSRSPPGPPPGRTH